MTTGAAATFTIWSLLINSFYRQKWGLTKDLAYLQFLAEVFEFLRGRWSLYFLLCLRDQLGLHLVDLTLKPFAFFVHELLDLFHYRFLLIWQLKNIWELKGFNDSGVTTSCHTLVQTSSCAVNGASHASFGHFGYGAPWSCGLWHGWLWSIIVSDVVI